MSFVEDIIKLRKRVSDAVSKGIVANEGKNFLEASLIQVMNDAERNRQNCVTQADNLRKQAATFEGQASAFASVSSIVYNVINGFVVVAERDEAERLEAQAEKEREKSEDTGNVELPLEPVEKKTRKKKS